MKTSSASHEDTHNPAQHQAEAAVISPHVAVNPRTDSQSRPRKDLALPFELLPDIITYTVLLIQDDIVQVVLQNLENPGQNLRNPGPNLRNPGQKLISKRRVAISQYVHAITNLLGVFRSAFQVVGQVLNPLQAHLYQEWYDADSAKRVHSKQAHDHAQRPFCADCSSRQRSEDEAWEIFFPTEGGHCDDAGTHQWIGEKDSGKG